VRFSDSTRQNALPAKNDQPRPRKGWQGWSSAMRDFRRARSRASAEKIVARLSGKPAELLCYKDVPERMRTVRTVSRGLQDIPIDAIAGSVGRCTDFTRSFLPLQDSDQARWAKVKMAWNDLDGLPPIEVYQIGQVYFVLDGNHRVSVARQRGLHYLEAYVTELLTPVPLSPGDSPDDLIVKAEYAEFLDRTGLHELRPGIDLSMSAPGHYRQLEEEISAYQHAVAIEEKQETSFEVALAGWYDRVYLPIVRIIRERSLLRGFPDRTETDLYVWILNHRAELSQELGREIGPEEAARDLAGKLGSRHTRILARAVDRLHRALKQSAKA
jgi:hypothetical protein